MNWRDNLRKFVKVVDKEYERRIRAASHVKQYKIDDVATDNYDEPASEQILFAENMEVGVPTMSTATGRNWVERLGNVVGRFLSDFTRVLVTLFLYIGLSFGTWLVLRWVLNDDTKAFRVAYGIATGQDAFDFARDMRGHPILWRWLLVFHVLSWLVVPVLAATAVDAAYRIVEQRRRRAERELRMRLQRIGTVLNLSGSELDDFVNDGMDVFLHS